MVYFNLVKLHLNILILLIHVIGQLITILAN